MALSPQLWSARLLAPSLPAAQGGSKLPHFKAWL